MSAGTSRVERLVPVSDPAWWNRLDMGIKPTGEVMYYAKDVFDFPAVREAARRNGIPVQKSYNTYLRCYGVSVKKLNEGK